MRVLDFLKRKLPHNLKIRKLYGIGKGFFAFIFNFYLLKDFKIIGISGTDGKTSTCVFTTELFENFGISCGMMSTEKHFLNGKFLENKSKRTTASAFEIFSFIKKIKSFGGKVLILEVSSHSLEQGRIFGIKFFSSLITNISREHLDYHKNLEEYAETKAKLFGKTLGKVFYNENLELKSIFEKKIFCEKEIIYFDKKDEKVFSINFIKSSEKGIYFDVNYFGKVLSNLFLPILGKYNLENISFSIILLFLFLDEKKIFENLENNLKKINPVEGRFEKLDFVKDFNVFISFGVTPNAILQTLDFLNSIKKNKKVFIVFGATGGQHDHSKRKIMGEIAGNNADFSVLTDDETYGENSENILKDLEKGILKTKGKYKIIQNRKQAIKFALENMEKGDFLLITGMGNLETRNVGGKEVDFSERKIVKEFFK